MLQMPPRGRNRGRPVRRAPARQRRARTPPVLDRRSDLDSGSSDDEQQPFAQLAGPVQQPALLAQLPVMRGDPAPPILQPQHPTIENRMERMQLMLNMQNVRIEGLLENRQVQADPNLHPQQHNQQPLQVPPADPYQHALAQGALAVEGLRFPPVQDPGESPLAPWLILGSVIDISIKTKVWEGRFIELATLFHSTPKPSYTVSYNGENPSFSMTAPKASPPSTYREWLDLFLIYSAIIMEARPQEAAGLFTYIARIGELEASDYSLVWFDYDIAFRRLRAIKQDLPWQKTVMEILWPIQMRRQAVAQNNTPQNCHLSSSSQSPDSSPERGRP